MDWDSGEEIRVGAEGNLLASVDYPKYFADIAALREGQEYLKSPGFKRFCTFEGTKPVFHAL